MNNLNLELFYSKTPLDEEGSLFLVDRFLEIPLCIKCGIRSLNGMIYFYYMMDGKPVRSKCRSMSDKKVQFTSTLDECAKQDFKMPFFMQFKDPTNDDLFITEGEFDCIALRSLGAVNVVSLPNGAQSVKTSFTNNYEFLQKFKRIFIAFDMDKVGKEAAKEAMKLISPAKYRRINFPCKDANDWIKSDSSLTFKDLEFLMENASLIENKRFMNMADLPDHYYDQVDTGSSSGWGKLDGVLMGIRRGELTVVSADTASGKSTFCLNLIKNLAEQGHGVWINSYELKPETVNRKVAGIVLGKNFKIAAFPEEDRIEYNNWMIKRNCRLNISTDKIDIKTLRNDFEIASLAYNVKYILLDHLDYIQCNGKKDTSLENIDEAMREIHAMALEFNMGVILVVHPTQASGGNVTLHNLKGSSAIKQYADNVIIIRRCDLVGEKNPEPFRVNISIQKNRLFGTVCTVDFRYVPKIDGYTDAY